jgi:signal transduction histidine kinase
MSRARAVDLVVIDCVLAALLTVGALAYAALLSDHRLPALATVSCVVITGSVAWRRPRPALTTLVALTALLGFLGVNHHELKQGQVLLIADVGVLLNFYLLGRRARGRGRFLVSGFLLAYALAVFAAISHAEHIGSVGDVLGNWMPAAALFAVGRTFATRSALTRELEVTRARLEDEQEMRARRAGAEERNRMARELHDVIAHCVSVMVVQTGAARQVAVGDPEAARGALQVVESSGREALVELRRIVGALRHGDDALAESATLEPAQLEALADRARAAGLPVELRVEGTFDALPPGLGRVAYRLVQEALTNGIKHAGPARASVSVIIGARELELEVLDTGTGAVPGLENRDGAGHGLIGMRQRVALYGGELHAGPRGGGGFEVRARIPLEARATSPPVLAAAEHDRFAVPAADDLRWPWLDPLLAVVVLVALEIEALTSSYRRGPLFLNMLAVGALALAILWRRRQPLVFLIVSGVLVDCLSGGLTAVSAVTLVGTYTVLALPYAVGAWEDRRRAVLGLAIWICGAAVDGIVSHGGAGDFVGAIGTGTVVWAVGRAIHSRRMLIAALRRTLAQLAAERADRERLAVAGERSRIARELHAVVAGNVAAMVVQAQAAQGLMGPGEADTAMGAIEGTGRQALSEMRRILGVLRHAGEGGELEPQPGVDQVYTLIQHARERGQRIELSVDGEPGTLPAGVNLGLYRILEDALHAVGQHSPSAVGVALRFSADELAVHLTASCREPTGWPTNAMRERVALCGGELGDEGDGEPGWQFVARMPREAQGALA